MTVCTAVAINIMPVIPNLKLSIGMDIATTAVVAVVVVLVGVVAGHGSQQAA